MSKCHLTVESGHMEQSNVDRECQEGETILIFLEATEYNICMIVVYSKEIPIA
jgi:hypothetical protein